MGKSQMRRLREASMRFRREEPVRYAKMVSAIEFYVYLLKAGKVEINGK